MKRYILASLLVGWSLTGLAETAGLIRSGDHLVPGGYHLVLEAADGATMVNQLGLREAGIRAADVFQAADEIRIFADASNLDVAPLARIWVHAGSGTYRFHTGGEGDAGTFLLPQGAAVVVYLRASTSLVPWPKPEPH